MSTNTDTVLKLSEALTELIEAYEKLQQENDEINAKNRKLEQTLENIQKDKDSIESNFYELNENSEKQENNINSMLGKIESLLGVNKNNPKKVLKDIVVDNVESDNKEIKEENSKHEAQELEDSIFNVPVQHENSSASVNNLSNIDIKKSGNMDISITKVEEKIEINNNQNRAQVEDDNKLDLNRMASLLNGFNK